MKEAIIPFLLYLIIQIFIFFVGMNVINKEDEFQYSSFFDVYVLGQITVFAIIEVLAVPMILLRLPFDVLYWSFIILVTVIIVIGIKKFIGKNKSKIPSIKKYVKSMSPFAIIMFTLMILIILAQFFVYFFGQHLDEDDARWLAEANDAIEYGDMMTRHFSTGDYQGMFTYAKDVTSPWAMMWAILARTLHTRTSIAVHTVYASFELLVMYMIYYLIARELFNKKESRFVFVFFAAVINMFYAGTRYTQSVFSMVRIWQGKATVAAIIIPLILYIFICINKRNDLSDWLKLPIICCGSCLMSGMGVSLSAIMIMIYGLYNVIAYKNIKRLPLLILTVAPSVVFSLIYFYFKG